MADIILKNKKGEDVTYTGVNKISIPTADGTAVFTEGGASVDFGINVGDAVGDIYLNTSHDTTALDTMLAGLSYPAIANVPTCILANVEIVIDENTTSTIPMMAGDYTAVIPNCYGIMFGETVLYVTEACSMPDGTSIPKGWQMDVFPSNGMTSTVLEVHSAFAEVKDNYFAKSKEAFGGKIYDVEPLEITANGSYTATEGKAFSSVTVDVPTSGGGTLTRKRPRLDVDYSSISFEVPKTSTTFHLILVNQGSIGLNNFAAKTLSITIDVERDIVNGENINPFVIASIEPYAFTVRESSDGLSYIYTITKTYLIGDPIAPYGVSGPTVASAKYGCTAIAEYYE